MKFRIYSTSCFFGTISKKQESKLKKYNLSREDDFLYIEIDNLEELVKLSKTLNKPVILSVDGEDLELEIYDDYRE